MLSADDLQALWLTLKLAGLVTALLMLCVTPLAWLLARSRGAWKRPLQAIITLPMVLPPTVIGFYLLLALAPAGPLGSMLSGLGLAPLPFSFSGLVVASMVYSLPFVALPLVSAFESVDQSLIEAAAALRAGPIDRFFSVVLPQCRAALITAAVLGFVHTLGEFGVVLMIGGSIPGETKLVSIQIYDHVEAFDYDHAHALSAVLLVFSFCTLLLLYALNARARFWK